MDFDSSSKFIASLTKFMQSLCNGFLDIDKEVEICGHICINVDNNTVKKLDYIINEKMSTNGNNVTFTSNSFLAQPAEKPKPLPEMTAERTRNPSFHDDQNAKADLDQKPLIDPDISIEEEYISNQSSCSFSGSSQTSGYSLATTGAPSHQPDVLSESSLEGAGNPSSSGPGERQMAYDYPVMIRQSASSYAGAPAGASSHQPNVFALSFVEGTGNPSNHSLDQRSTSSSPPWLPGTRRAVSGCENSRECDRIWLENPEDITLYYHCALCTGMSYERKSDLMEHIHTKHRKNFTA